MASVIHQHLGSELPTDVLLSFSPKLADLLRGMLAKKTGDRFQTPVELKQSLDDILADAESNELSAVPVRIDSSARVANGGSDAYTTGELIAGSLRNWSGCHRRCLKPRTYRPTAWWRLSH